MADDRDALALTAQQCRDYARRCRELAAAGVSPELNARVASIYESNALRGTYADGTPLRREDDVG